VPGYESFAPIEHESAKTSAYAPPRTEAPSPVDADETPSEIDETPTEGIAETAAPPTAEDDPPEGGAPREGVSELEKEMARLLDEISTARRD